VAGYPRVVGVVTAVGGEVERDRETLLSGGEIAPVEGVGILRRGEAGILPDGPGLADIHGGVGAAQVWRDAGPGIEEVDAFEVRLAIEGLDQDPLRREPGFGVTRGAGVGGALERDICKVGYSAHTTGLVRSSWPDLFRPSTSCFPDGRKMWRPGTSPGMTCSVASLS